MVSFIREFLECLYRIVQCIFGEKANKQAAIDVSQYQGDIDWTKVKDAGCRYAVLRCVRSNNKLDEKLWDNINGCLKNKITFDFYVYTAAVDAVGLKKQLAVFDEQFVTKLDINYGHIKCRIWWDVEDKVLKNVGSKKLTALLQEARAEIESRGFAFGIYTGKSFYESGYFDPKQLKCPYWIARYPLSMEYVWGKDVPPEDKKPDIPGLVMWQYTSNGRIEGISGKVDFSKKY